MRKELVFVMISVFLLSSVSFALAEGITGDVTITVRAVGDEEEDNLVIEVEDYNTINGYTVQIQKQEGAGGGSKLTSEGVSAESELEVEEEEQDDGEYRIMTKLSSGKSSEIKVMPNVASEKAIEALKISACKEEEGCTIELKEVGSGESAKLAYEVQAKKRARLFWVIPTNMKVKAQVDAETGDVVETKRSWWGFLAKEVNAE